MRTISTLLFLQLLFLGCQKNETGNTTTVKVIPPAPSDLIVTLLSGTKVKLDWIDKSTNEDGFKIERKTGSSGFSVAGMTAKDITTFTDSALSLGSSYTYRVYAYNTVGASLTYTNEVTITTIGVPVLTTLPITDTTAKTALSGGLVSTDGGSPISVRGVVWGTASNPTIALSSKTTDGTGTGSFSSKITGLMANTKYYARAYATNNAGTSYGNELSFTTNNIDLDAGLVAYYPFNGNANDESGNGNNGTVNGPLLTSDRGNNANAAYGFFNCNEIHATINTSNIKNGVSLSFWYYRNATGCIAPRIMEFSQGSNAPGQLIIEENFPVGVKLSEHTISGTSDWRMFSTLVNQTWIHLVYTNDGLLQRLYQNGILINSYNSPGFSTLDGNVSFGRMNHPAFDGINGKLDDIRIYNRAISQAEVKYLLTH